MSQIEIYRGIYAEQNRRYSFNFEFNRYDGILAERVGDDIYFREVNQEPKLVPSGGWMIEFDGISIPGKKLSELKVPISELSDLVGKE